MAKVSFFKRLNLALNLLVQVQIGANLVLVWYERLKIIAAGKDTLEISPAEAEELRMLLKPLKEVAEEIA